MKDRDSRGILKKAYVDLPESTNPIICMHNGALPMGGYCFATYPDKVHLDCYLAHQEQV
jgi:hypothetical protein